MILTGLMRLGQDAAIRYTPGGDAVANLDDGPDRAGLDAGVERIDRGLDDAGDLVGTNGHRYQIS